MGEKLEDVSYERRFPHIRKYVEGRNLEKYGDTTIVCRMFGQSAEIGKLVEPSVPLTGDIIHDFFEEFHTSPYHLALHMSYYLEEFWDIIIPITNKQLFRWRIDTNKGITTIVAKFLISPEDHEAQLAILQENGIKTSLLKFSEYEYIDFGELNPECIISFQIHDTNSWHIRQEICKISRVKKHGLGEEDELIQEDAHIIALAIERPYQIRNGEVREGMLSFALGTPFPIFTEEAIAKAPSYKDITAQDLKVVVKTDNDCSFTHDDLESSEEEYQERVKECEHRQAFWNAVFNTTSSFVSLMFRTYIPTLSASFQNDNTVQVYKKDFLEWLESQKAVELFMKELEQDYFSSVDEFSKLREQLETVIVKDDTREAFKLVQDTLNTTFKDVKTDADLDSNTVAIQSFEILKSGQMATFIKLLLRDMTGTDYTPEMPDSLYARPDVRYILNNMGSIFKKLTE
jgi:hypothetical protein